VSQLIPVVQAVNPNALYMSENAMTIQFGSGITPLKSFLTMEEDCALMIPLSIPESAHVTVWEEGNPAGDRFTLPLRADKAWVMTGRTSLRMNNSDPMVCMIFCLAGGTGS
jgi:hypothetical protein